MRIAPDVAVGLRLALRARFVSISFWLMVSVLGVAWMAAQFSGRQPATVALDVGLSVIRLALPVIGILLLQELVSREFDRRLFLTSLTYPRPRHRFLLGRLLSVGALLAALLVALGASLSALVAWLAAGYDQATPVALGWPYWLTLCFVLVDLFVILAMGALLAVVAVTPSFVLIGTLGFMLVARSFSTIVQMLQRQTWLVQDAETYSSSLGVLGYLLPDLAALDVRMIALYGQMNLLPTQWPWHLAGALAYGVALVGLAVWALKRRRIA